MEYILKHFDIYKISADNKIRGETTIIVKQYTGERIYFSLHKMVYLLQIYIIFESASISRV